LKPEDSDEPISNLGELLGSAGELKAGSGLLSGVIAVGLGALALLSVIAFHFPAYLTTPELRQKYDVEILRYVLAAALILSGALASFNILKGRRRWLSAWALALVCLSFALGGPSVPVEDFADHTPYLGIDFLVLDLLGSTLVFVAIEKLFALRKDQPIFRPEWQNDLVHFGVNHLAVGLFLFLVNRVIFSAMGVASLPALQEYVRDLPLLAALLGAVFVADLAQYWVHRAYHEVPLLWRFHSVHHSAPAMDWVAGSRQHLLEVIVTRMLVLTPLYVLGFAQNVIDAYIVVVGFQAVFNHANVSVRLGWFSRVIVTPNFHHWHHSQDDEAIDRNYSAHFAFIDHLFGTAVQADRKWPDRYGVVGNYMPLGFLKQQAFPFTRQKTDPVADAD